MAKRVAITNLNATTVDIINTIRANANAEYQSLVPAITTEHDIPAVGEVLFGYPALANQFLTALINRIAAVKVKSANFNNMYADLKKGYLEFGETVEEVFVSIAKAREFSAEKGEAREFKRSMPDVKSAFHAMNWRVQYPVTIQDEDLRTAFLSASGVQDLIARIVDSLYTAASYDEFLLFKYLIIKSVAHGKMYPVPVNMSDIKNAAVAFRGMSNKLQFMSNKYNSYGVTTVTPKSDQYIFMDSDFNAGYDVNVLAAAFNMDKAEFSGKLKLIDDFTTFDNDRWDIIRANSDMVESVTDAELALMANVKAILVDGESFQIYDNLDKFTEKYVASGLYWNYFYNVWKTVSFSPFSNAVVFVDNSVDTVAPDSITMKVTDKSVSASNTILTFDFNSAPTGVAIRDLEWIQTQAAVQAGIAVHKYGAIIYPANADGITLEFKIGDVVYKASATTSGSADVGDTRTFIRADYVPDQLSALSITNVTLTPSFAAGTYTYTGATTSASGTLTATADEDATVAVTMNDTPVTGTTLSFASGSGNVLKVKVTGVSKGQAVSKTYQVTITRS